jgi:hypothetical protein
MLMAIQVVLWGYYNSLKFILDPPGLELRRLIVENGGEFHTYYVSGRTTYKIAMSLAISKWKSMARHEIFLKPSWIVDS